MESELKVELEKLNGNLDRIFDKMKDVDEDIKGLASDVKEIKSDVAGQGREISEIKADTNHNKIEIEKLHAEDKSIWLHFPEFKKDIKEYVGIISKQESANSKLWFYGIAMAGAVAVIGHLVRTFVK